jgi:hypothetical protein
MKEGESEYEKKAMKDKEIQIENSQSLIMNSIVLWLVLAPLAPSL